ncbi:MAG: hypothetical protein JXR68_02445 [Bacteroidales bacterium]|nr:hypothetical protein [Bacteroidales bacterium]
MKEIERKFLLEAIPKDIYIVEKINIEQYYLCSDNGFVTRIRKIDEVYNVGFKTGSGLERLEKEILISENDFNDLKKMKIERKIRKFRHICKIDEYKIEIDEFRDNLQGLLVAEVEFLSLNDAENFTPLSWFGIELTNDMRFTNAQLSKLKDLTYLHL